LVNAIESPQMLDRLPSLPGPKGSVVPDRETVRDAGENGSGSFRDHLQAADAATGEREAADASAIGAGQTPQAQRDKDPHPQGAGREATTEPSASSDPAAGLAHAEGETVRPEPAATRVHGVATAEDQPVAVASGTIIETAPDAARDAARDAAPAADGETPEIKPQQRADTPLRAEAIAMPAERSIDTPAGLNQPAAPAMESAGGAGHAQIPAAAVSASTPAPPMIQFSTGIDPSTLALSGAAKPPLATIEQVPDVIVRHLEMRGDDNSRLVVQLDPPELGRVVIEFQFEGAELRKLIVTGENAEALRQLRLAHYALSEALGDHGMSGDQMDFQQQGGSDRQERQGETEGFRGPDMNLSPASDRALPEPAQLGAMIAGTRNLDLRL